jgi:hypothetical protein
MHSLSLSSSPPWSSSASLSYCSSSGQQNSLALLNGVDQSASFGITCDQTQPDDSSVRCSTQNTAQRVQPTFKRAITGLNNYKKQVHSVQTSASGQLLPNYARKNKQPLIAPAQLNFSSFGLPSPLFSRKVFIGGLPPDIDERM